MEPASRGQSDPSGFPLSAPAEVGKASRGPRDSESRKFGAARHAAVGLVRSLCAAAARVLARPPRGRHL